MRRSSAFVLAVRHRICLPRAFFLCFIHGKYPHHWRAL